MVTVMVDDFEEAALEMFMDDYETMQVLLVDGIDSLKETEQLILVATFEMEEVRLEHLCTVVNLEATEQHTSGCVRNANEEYETCGLYSCC